MTSFAKLLTTTLHASDFEIITIRGTWWYVNLAKKYGYPSCKRAISKAMNKVNLIALVRGWPQWKFLVALLGWWPQLDDGPSGSQSKFFASVHVWCSWFIVYRMMRSPHNPNANCQGKFSISHSFSLNLSRMKSLTNLDTFLCIQDIGVARKHFTKSV